MFLGEWLLASSITVARHDFFRCSLHGCRAASYACSHSIVWSLLENADPIQVFELPDCEAKDVTDRTLFRKRVVQTELP